MAGTKTAPKGVTKTESYKMIAEATELTRKQVAAVFDELTKLIKQQMGKKGPGVYTVPGLLKIKRIHKPAKPAHDGINPFTKEPQHFAAKPARNVVKALPLKGLKDMVK